MSWEADDHPAASLVVFQPDQPSLQDKLFRVMVSIPDYSLVTFQFVCTRIVDSGCALVNFLSDPPSSLLPVSLSLSFWDTGGLASPGLRLNFLGQLHSLNLSEYVGDNRG